MPKITVCKGCGQAMAAVDKNGKPACITCRGLDANNSVPVLVDIPDHLECDYHCGSVADWDENEKVWNVQIGHNSKGGWNCTDYKTGKGRVGLENLPFVDSKKATFYCGCKGWD